MNKLIFILLFSLIGLDNFIAQDNIVEVTKSKSQRLEFELAGGYWVGFGANHLSIFQKNKTYFSFSNGLGTTKGVYKFLEPSFSQKIHLGFNLGKKHSFEFGPGYSIVVNFSGRSIKKEDREAYMPGVPNLAFQYDPILEPIYNMAFQYNYKFNKWSFGISSLVIYSYFYNRDIKQFRPFVGLHLSYLIKEKINE